MKKILFLIVFTNLIYADLLVILTNNNSLCVADSYKENTNRYTFKRLPYNIVYPINKADVVEIKSNYTYNSSTNECESQTNNPNPNLTPDENGLIMGMEEKDYHFSLAIWGIMLASLISFGFIKAF